MNEQVFPYRTTVPPLAAGPRIERITSHWLAWDGPVVVGWFPIRTDQPEQAQRLAESALERLRAARP